VVVRVDRGVGAAQEPRQRAVLGHPHPVRGLGPRPVAVVLEAIGAVGEVLVERPAEVDVQ
jgi:hypothetical protein